MFTWPFINFLTVSYDMFLTAVRHEVNNLESSVVVQELEFAINRALYVFLWSLGNQYIEGSLSWRSLTHSKIF